MYLTLLFLFFLGIQVFFFLFFFSKLLFYKEVPSAFQGTYPGVSVIIAAHNEKENLEKLIPALLDQDYPTYEIIIADDRSEDGTAKFLADISSGSDKIRTVTISKLSEGTNGKKDALTNAIDLAQFENLLLTDADCIPASKSWIRRMSQGFFSKKDLVLGYSPYKKEKGLLNLMIRYETLYTGIQYLSFALRGLPYMGVGRNMAYSKSLFLAGEGFRSHAHVTGGDDDLFVQQHATGKNTCIQINEDAAMISKPKTTFESWYRQKWRHLCVGRKYSTGTRCVLGMLIISHIGFYLVFPFLFKESGILLGITGFSLRTILLISIFTTISHRLNDKFTWFWLPLIDILYIFFYIIVGIKAAVFKKNSWT